MADSNILSDFGINILEEEIDDVIFQTNEFLTDATFTGSQGPFWWILQMCMALAALFSIVVAGNIAYKMMVKHEPLDVMKLFRPLAISVILCWWYPPADTGITNSGSSWCFLDFLSYIPNCIGSYTHDLYQAESLQIEDKFEEVQELIYVRDTLYTSLQAQADVAHSGTSDPNLIESTMEQTGVEGYFMDLNSAFLNVSPWKPTRPPIAGVNHFPTPTFKAGVIRSNTSPQPMGDPRKAEAPPLISINQFLPQLAASLTFFRYVGFIGKSICS